jgi:5-methylcytosine-specific restriction endonuclease McrA
MKICRECGISSKTISFKADANICKPCLKLYNMQYRIENKDYLAAQKKEYSKNNRPIFKRTAKTWRTKHPEKKLADTRKRQVQKLNRTPKWLTKSDWIEINWAYAWARQLTKETGIKHVVDHIIPLQGKTISGLHCPQNLQVITAKENSLKANKFPYIKES